MCVAAFSEEANEPDVGAPSQPCSPAAAKHPKKRLASEADLQAAAVTTITGASSAAASPAHKERVQLPSSAKRQKGGVSFGAVEIFEHRPALNGCSVPSDGRAPLGLGHLQAIGLRRMDSYDAERRLSRQGIRSIPASERVRLLETIGLHRTSSIDAVEGEIAKNRMGVALPAQVVVPEVESVSLVDLWA